jgi:hypothetical protein
MCPEFNPDFSEASQPILLPGSYIARIKGVEPKTSERGNHYLNWKMEIETPTQHRGVTIFYNTMLSGKGAFTLRQLIQATIDPNYESGRFNTDGMIGFPVQVELEKQFDQSGNEKKYLGVKAVAPVPSGYAAGQDSDDIGL